MRRFLPLALITILLSGCALSQPAPVDPGDGSFTLPSPTSFHNAGDSPDRRLPNSSAGSVFLEPPAGEGLERYLDQAITWAECQSGLCTEVLVPLDWQDPDRTAISLALVKQNATQEPYLGALFVHPGGPGGSATDFVGRVADKQFSNYDIIGVDTRGTGESTRVACGSDSEIEAFLALDATPDDEAEKQTLIAGSKRYADRCREESGDLLDHISSIEAVYDYELIRRLLDQEKFNYLGVSYGTYLGALYAELYPQFVGRMVLDAPVNITNSGPDQVIGFDRALSAFLNHCDDNVCQLGDNKAAVQRKITDFLTELDSNPLPVGDRLLTQNSALSGILLYLYFPEDYFQYLDLALSWAILRDDGSYLLDAADLLDGRDPGGSYADSNQAFNAVRCIDEADEGLASSFDDWTALQRTDSILGPFWGPDVICPVWTARGEQPVRFRALTTPIIIVSSTGDSATPYEHGNNMARVLQSHLIQRSGAGHGSVMRSTGCVDEAVRSYLIDGTMPTRAVTKCDD